MIDRRFVRDFTVHLDGHIADFRKVKHSLTVLFVELGARLSVSE